MSRLKSLLFLLVLAAQVPLASATVTYVVGSCRPSLPSFPTIQSALDAAPPANIVEVCPGTYPEQIVMGGNPVSVEGITAGNSSQAIIAVPAGGLHFSATTDQGYPMYAQVFVQSGGQEVNLSNLTVDGTGNNVTGGGSLAGVFYLGSSGRLNHLAVQNQNGTDNFGTGIWLQGGIPTANVTIENCIVQGFDNTGIMAETNSSLPELIATINDNYVSGEFPYGIQLLGGETAYVNSNLIAAFWGVLIEGGEGSVSRNKIVQTAPFNYTGGTGISLSTDGVSVTSNEILDSLSTGIAVGSSVAPVTGNTITESGIAIDFEGEAGSNVHSNAILGSGWGLIFVPAGAASSNTFYDTGTIKCGTSWPTC